MAAQDAAEGRGNGAVPANGAASASGTAAPANSGQSANGGQPANGSEPQGEQQPVLAGAEQLTIPYVRAEQERRAATAQRQLDQLGKVNPLALEEFAALEERHAFLNTQLEDLKKTRRAPRGLGQGHTKPARARLAGFDRIDRRSRKGLQRTDLAARWDHADRRRRL